MTFSFYRRKTYLFFYPSSHLQKHIYIIFFCIRIYSKTSNKQNETTRRVFTFNVNTPKTDVIKHRTF